MMMHGYECLECGFRWRQQVYEERTRCIACSEHRCRYLGAEEREIPAIFNESER